MYPLHWIRASSRSFRFSLSITLLTLITGGCGQEDSGPTAPDHTIPELAKARSARAQYLIEMRATRGKDFERAVARLGGRVKRDHKAVGLVSVTGLSPSAAAQLARRADVVSVTPDRLRQWIPPRSGMRLQVKKSVSPGRIRPSGTDQTSAEFFDTFQWNIRQIKADKAYTTASGGRGALVCVLDTGVDPEHQDLRGKVDLTKSASILESDPDIFDRVFHGTFVSALIVSNGIGMASVAPNARLCEVKLFNLLGQATDDDILTAILFAVDQGADVINMSFGDYFDTKQPGGKDLLRAYQKVIDFAASRRVTMVASTGNDAMNLDRDPSGFILVPAQLPHVIGVGATAPINQEHFDLLASYSNFGHTGNTVVAPGGDLVEGGDFRDLIFSACSRFVSFLDENNQLIFPCASGNEYLLTAGTSFAAPHVSGEAAIIQSLNPGNHAKGKVDSCIWSTADQVGSHLFFGHGRINVLSAAAGCRG